MQDIKFKVQLEIHKKGEMIFFSQLDLVKIFERALRRTNLPLYFTKGYNPHLKMSFDHALKLGVEGSLNVTFYFSEMVSPSALKTQLQNQLPSGLEILNCTSLP